VIFLHLPIGETCFRQGELLYIHYKTFSFFICFLGSQVREATASVRRTQLAVVRRKSTVVTQFKILNLNSRYRQSQSINKVPTRFDVYIKGNRNDIFATRGADIAILTGFGEHLFTKVHGFISNN
jgi:hypothetical protein